MRCRDDWRLRSRNDAYPIAFDRLETWTPDLAYFIGLMLTDGNVIAAGPVSFVSLDQCSTEFIRDFIAPTTPIREERTKGGTIAYRWSVWSGRLAVELARLGVMPKKSLTGAFPVVPEAVAWDFVRGVLDGDGSVDQARRATFASGSRAFSEGLRDFFTEHGLKATMYTNTRSYPVYLSVASSRVLAGLMYRDDAPCLERKRLRFHQPFIPELTPSVGDLLLGSSTSPAS